MATRARMKLRSRVTHWTVHANHRPATDGARRRDRRFDHALSLPFRKQMDFPTVPPPPPLTRSGRRPGAGRAAFNLHFTTAERTRFRSISSNVAVFLRRGGGGGGGVSAIRITIIISHSLHQRRGAARRLFSSSLAQIAPRLGELK